MNKFGNIFYLLGITLFSLIGCQHSNYEELVNQKSSNTVDTFDFAFIKKAPEATESHDLKEVIKVYFNENDSSQDKGFDIKKGMYL